jgi:citrate lyase subunit beta/citryl-CoA lyase
MAPSSYRSRRTCLAVPGSSPRFLEKARGLPVDEVFLDLEDAVAPGAKPAARAAVVAALNGGGWAGQIRAVRINDASTPWAYRDVIEVVEGAGPNLDVIILPKASDPAQVSWLDLLLSQVEQAAGLERGRIGIEAQIEDARGLADVTAIAAASDRLEALVFGPADFMASLGMRSLQVGAQPAGYTGGDAYHYPRVLIMVALRSRRIAASADSYLAIRDVEVLRQYADSAAALGYDGKWVLHPGQVDVVNEVFAPDQESYDRAELILDAYAHATEVQQTGAVMLGDEMIDEASRKLALVTAAKGRAAGLARTQPPAPSRPLPAPAVPPQPSKPQPQPSTPQAASVSARPLVRGRPASSAWLTQRASAASSPAASVPPVTVAA